MDLYYKSDRISQSHLKKILIHPKSFYYNDYNDDIKIPKEHLLIGNAVDCLLTEPEKWESKFKIIKEIPEVKGMFKDFLDKLFETRLSFLNGDISEEYWLEYAFKAVTPVNTKFKLDDFIENYNKGTHPYYEYLLNSLDFQYLSQEIYEKVLEIKNSLYTNNFTRHLFSEDDQKILKQLEIDWEYHGVLLKSKLDLVIIDDVNKTIRLVDVKTTENPRRFKDVFERFRYGFQAVAYTLAFKQWATEWKDYKLLPFTFVVEGVKYTGSPLIYEVTEETFNKNFTDFNIACEKYLFHTSNNMWDYSMEDYLSQAVVKL